VNEPAHWGVRRKLLDAGSRLGLARPALRLYEVVLAARSHASAKRQLEEGGLPLPPARLRDLSLKRLTASERQTLLNDGLVVIYEDAPGTSLCSAYHPPDYVQHNLGADYELVAFRPATEDGRHDLHLFRKPAVSDVFAEQPS
jgi:hypothetical protein